MENKNKGFITIPSATTHKLFKMGADGVDAFTLYSFYQYTSLWQNEKFGINNRPFATREYCKKGLRWGTSKFVSANKILLDENLVTKRVARNEQGKITGHYIELPFVSLNKTTCPQMGHMDSAKTTCPPNPLVDGKPTNTDGVDSINTDVKDRPLASQVERLTNTTHPHMGKATHLGDKKHNPIVYDQLLALAHKNENYEVNYIREGQDPDKVERSWIKKNLVEHTFEEVVAEMADQDKPWNFERLINGQV